MALAHVSGGCPSCKGLGKKNRQRSSFAGRPVATKAHNGSKWVMAQWLENKAEVDVAAPIDVCWKLWEDRERIPQWMPWIKSVKVVETDPRLSRWTLSTHQFGRDWEFSWLARNLAPIRYQKIHWRSEPGSASYGLEVDNRGEIRFVRRPGGTVNIRLTISYEVPTVLVPFASALTPVVEGIIQQDMYRFRDYVAEYIKTEVRV